MLTRRQLLARGLAVGAASLAAPALGKTLRRGVTLRVLGTHVTLQEQIRVAAEADLGIHIEFSPGGSASVLQQAQTRPESFHIYEQWSNSIPLLWLAGVIQPIDISRIDRWDEINSLSKTGRLSEGDTIGAGDAPHRLLYVQADGTLGSDRRDRISFLPYVHNVDSFGYDTRVIPMGTAYEEESWGWLLDDRWRGRVAVVNSAVIGIFDLALAARARGLVTFGDIGNMTVAEIDRMFGLLVDMKRDGHFSGAWSSVPESVEFMKTGRASIESMFSPGAASLRGLGVPVRYAAPKEGYRAWHGVMCLSVACGEEEAEAAYAYMNWWLSGRAGAVMARQGYYMSNPEASRPYMTDDEWGYWYEGERALGTIRGTDGLAVAEPGDRRNGGSYRTRFGRIAVWNTVMDNYEHTLVRWGEFLSTEARS